MNAGLSNLATLKSWLLAPGLVSGSDYNSQILAIGLGSAAQLERHCSRRFARLVGDTFETTADRAHLHLPRFPVAALSALDYRADAASAWSSILYDVVQQDLARGYVELVTEPGSFTGRLRATYTGGFWWEDKEPADQGYPTTMPEGATALPDDLRLAWLLQCEHLWSQRDKLGLQLAARPEGAAPPLVSLQLLPAVREQLRPYVRHTLI